MKSNLSSPSLNAGIKVPVIQLKQEEFINNAERRKDLLRLLKQYSKQQLFHTKTPYRVNETDFVFEQKILRVQRKKQRQGERFVGIAEDKFGSGYNGSVFDITIFLSIHFRFILDLYPEHFEGNVIYLGLNPQDPQALDYAIFVFPKVFIGSIPIELFKDFELKPPLTLKQIYKVEHQLVGFLKTIQADFKAIDSSELNIKTSKQKKDKIVKYYHKFSNPREFLLLRRESNLLQLIDDFHAKPLVYLKEDKVAYLIMDKMPGVDLDYLNRPRYQLEELNPEKKLCHNVIYYTLKSNDPGCSEFEYTIIIPKNPIFLIYYRVILGHKLQKNKKINLLISLKTC